MGIAPGVGSRLSVLGDAVGRDEVGVNDETVGFEGAVPQGKIQQNLGDD